MGLLEHSWWQLLQSKNYFTFVSAMSKFSFKKQTWRIYFHNTEAIISSGVWFFLSENLDSREAISVKHPLRLSASTTLLLFFHPCLIWQQFLKQFALHESFQRNLSFHNNNVLFTLTASVYVVLSSITKLEKQVKIA